MTLLITGATGFLGPWICRRMAAEGHEIRVLIRPQSDTARLKGLPVTMVCGDITDPNTLWPAVEGCDWVIHAAADLNYWRQDPALQMKINVDGTRNIARTCRQAGVKRLLHVSSVAAVGIPRNPAQPADETSPFELQSSGLLYHLSKRRAEEAVRSEIALGLNAVIVNPASITSPRRLGGLLHSIRRSPVVPCFSGGNCVVHVADVADGIHAAMVCGTAGDRYILGGENLTFIAMGEKAARAMGLKRRFVAIPPVVTAVASAVLEPWARRRHKAPKFSHMVHYCANRFMFYNSGKARLELHYQPRDFDAILNAALQPEKNGAFQDAA